jgi:cytidine deaminase
MPDRQAKGLATLLEEAKQASLKSYSPYSKFPVGCAIQADSGRIYRGCNIENVSFGLTICAERSALSSAVIAEGPDLKIKKVVIFTPTKVPISPCGGCRQVLREFGDNFEVVSLCEGKDIFSAQISDLIPQPPNIKFKK